ncbi:MAG: polysaccharide biosynthesis protein [Desulfobacteraceae bacterium]|nr:polysaccharide biosynthesis protein [Pseudomonadota bacterium]MBU4462320.1 polysaccharide biosynthesis protein [Pseudomonadota bacterium]MCG2754592.1 polysaccharide biosynthesis protein [Desulfobacteraceae bacterium]
MKIRPLYKNFLVVLAIDILLLTGSLYAAYLVRFDFVIDDKTLQTFKRILPFILITKLACFYFLDLYRGMWRYTSIADMINIIKASTIASLLIISIILFKTRFEGFARSVFVIDWCFTILFISAFRLNVRLYFEYFGDDKFWKVVKQILSSPFIKKVSSRKRLLIIGAGDCAEKIFRELRDNARLKYNVVGFLDDNPVKIGKKIHGIPVLGCIKDIKTIARQAKVDETLIAISSAGSKQMRTIVAHCKESGIEFKTVPGMGELIDGRVTINAIRKVAYRDLLGREAIVLDEEQIGAHIKGQCVMVTGAGGSIGSELCRQICRFRPKLVMLYEIAESPLYEIELELKQSFSSVIVVPLLADIQDKDELEKAIEAYKPQIIFHAAAYKHVPMLELQPWKAVENNIAGSSNLIDAAKKFNVERFVFVSTDKAVRPTNVMGASKRVAEMLVQSHNGPSTSDTQFIIVRFGNVAGSVGSVVPLFKKQIAKGGPVTVTHPDVTRYFMTIPEASQLILQAGAMGNGGEILLLDMGVPIKIDDMARDLIRLSGFEPDEDIRIDYVGLRPGEKLYEELITKGEGIVPTKHEKIMVLKGDGCDQTILNNKIKELIKFAKDQDEKGIKTKLQEIVPEYEPQF